MVGGAHIYIVDREGNNVHSFLLNSHHRLFTEAAMRTETPGIAGEDEVVKKAQEVVTTALEQQLKGG